MAKYTRYVATDFGSDPVVHTPVEEPRTFAAPEAATMTTYSDSAEPATERTYTRKRSNPALWAAPLALLAALGVGYWALSDRDGDAETQTAAAEQLQVAQAEPAAATPPAVEPVVAEPVEAEPLTPAQTAAATAPALTPRAAPAPRRIETARAPVRRTAPAPVETAAAEDVGADVSATVDAPVDASITAPPLALPPLPTTEAASAAPTTTAEPANEPIIP